MNNGLGLLGLLTLFGRLVPTLIITAGCVIYLSRRRNLAGVLLLTGNLLGVAVSLSSTLCLLAMRGGSLPPPQFQVINLVSTCGSLVAGLTFAAGFLLLMFRVDREIPAGPEYR